MQSQRQQHAVTTHLGVETSLLKVGFLRGGMGRVATTDCPGVTVLVVGEGNDLTGKVISRDSAIHHGPEREHKVGGGLAACENGPETTRDDQFMVKAAAGPFICLKIVTADHARRVGLR